MDTAFAPLLATLALVFCATALGILPMRKWIEVREARHELKRGSASFFRGLAGWVIVVIWIGATWFAATILGDWWVSEDLSGAIARSRYRLEILLHLLAALSDG
ncbi:hypothetical protein ACS3SW_11270 [Roseobacteraceae bacterium S113]